MSRPERPIEQGFHEKLQLRFESVRLHEYVEVHTHRTGWPQFFETDPFGRDWKWNTKPFRWNTPDTVVVGIVKEKTEDYFTLDNGLTVMRKSMTGRDPKVTVYRARSRSRFDDPRPFGPTFPPRWRDGAKETL